MDSSQHVPVVKWWMCAVYGRARNVLPKPLGDQKIMSEAQIKYTQLQNWNNIVEFWIYLDLIVNVPFFFTF